MINEKKIWLIEQYAQKSWTISLALSQEAARAGQYGKGYAIVAHEARILADKLYDYAAKVRFDSDDETMFNGIIDFVTMFKFLAVNAALEIVHMADISMDFNIPKSMSVFAEELRRLALNLSELANENMRMKPLTIPELTSPSDATEMDRFFLYSIAGYPLIENAKKILEVRMCARKTITEGNMYTVRGHEIPIVDCYRLMNLPYTGDENSQTIIIVSPQGKELGCTDGVYAVPIDDLDVNAIFYSRAGRAVTPSKSHVFANFTRECWDVVGGDQVVFVDWQQAVCMH